MQRQIRNFFGDNSGATAIEYALIASLVALAIITAVTSLGSRLSGEFSEVSTTFK